MRPARRPTAAVALVLVTLALAGCGGGGTASSASQQQTIDRSDAVCRRTSARIAALPSPEALTRGRAPTAADLPALADYFGKVASLQQAGVTELRDIDVPARDRNTVRAILDTVQSAVDALNAAVDAARAGDLDTFRQRYNDAVQTSTRAATAASRYGYKVCGQQ